MECTKCGSEAVMHAEYSGTHLCESHFFESVERRVQRRIRDDNLLESDNETWVIGLSGGKDSVVLTYILHETFAKDPRVEIICLSIHEGIEGYRDESLAASKEVTKQLNLQHETVSYAEEFDIEMDNVVEEDPENMAACAYCGVFRRDILARYAKQFNADKLLTGHNLDDEAETALMNILEGDVSQIAKHFDASLGPFDERHKNEDMIPRAKPLRDIPEKEVALYAQLKDLPVHMEECPHASESFRGKIQDILLELETEHPGTRHSIMAGYEKLAQLAATKYRDGSTNASMSTCEKCDAPTTGDLCQKCSLLESISAD